MHLSCFIARLEVVEIKKIKKLLPVTGNYFITFLDLENYRTKYIIKNCDQRKPA